MNIEKVSSIINFYKGKSIFVTGGSGFLGTALIEKLLRTCKDLKKIYILMKPKYKYSVEQRLDKLINSEVFNKLRERNPTALEKIIAVTGNLLEVNLGLNDKDIQILNSEVSVVFHCAANVNFNLMLHEALKVNTRATESMIHFCKGIKQLQALVYVSTAYTNSNKLVVDEKVYPTSFSLETVDYVARQPNSCKFEPSLLGARPNTYTFSKALSEELIQSVIPEVPAVIVRPSIITASLQQPMPGWVNGWNGVNSIIAQMGKGLLRCWNANPDGVLDIVPVDYVANLIIAAAWDTHRQRNLNKDEVKVFNCCSGLRNPVTVSELLYTCLDFSKQFFERDVLIRPTILIIKNYILFWIAFFFLQTLPMYLSEAFSCLFNRKAKYSMIQAHNKIQNLVLVCNFFALNQFTFIDNNVSKLYEDMDKDDQKTFDFNVEHIKWHTYFENYVLGLKKYILKEPMNKQPVTMG